MRDGLLIVCVAWAIWSWHTEQTPSPAAETVTSPQGRAVALSPLTLGEVELSGPGEGELETFAPSKEPVRRPLFPAPEPIPDLVPIVIPAGDPEPSPRDIDPLDAGDPVDGGGAGPAVCFGPTCTRPAPRVSGHWETRRGGVFGRRVVRVWVTH
jgi:hypothetical protein